MVQRIPRPIGEWTAKKLEHLSAYLDAFAKATQSSRQRFYIDAMVGCGECVIKRTGYEILGSAWRALNVEPQFTKIFLVELDKQSAAHLASRMSTYQNVEVFQGDCNVVIPESILPQLSRRAPSLAFLDPTGVQPGWELVQRLAAHRRGSRGEKVELLILFAFDMFINRWLKREPLWPILDAFYGTRAWREELRDSLQLNEDTDERRTRFMQLYMRRIEGLGYRFVESLGPLQKRNRVLYHMIFATDHPVARKIMTDVWKNKLRPIPGELGYQRTFELEPHDK